MSDPYQQLTVLLALICRDLDAILADGFVQSGGFAIYSPLCRAAEDLGDIAYFVGPKGDALATSISNSERTTKRTPLEWAHLHAKSMREQLDLASAAGMKPFLQFQRLYESAQTLPAFIDDVMGAHPNGDVPR